MAAPTPSSTISTSCRKREAAGSGSVVLDLLEAEARELGLAALFLVVDPDNPPALRLYDARASRARTGC